MKNNVSSTSQYNGASAALACLCVTDAGNAYAQVWNTPGAAFEKPINTSARGEAPTYRVAPYIGVSMARPGNGKAAIFYDVDNKRFMGWKQGYVVFLMNVLKF